MHETHPELHTKLSRGHRYDLTTNIFERLKVYFLDDVAPNNEKNYIQIFGRYQGARVYRWIKREFIDNHENLAVWKVFLAKANGTGMFGEVLSQPILGQPSVAHTQTFISIGAFKTRNEAESLLKYIKTKFARAMLGTLKVTQDNKKDSWTNVPLQNFTHESDIDWSKSVPEIDQQLYAKYGLTQAEIAFIEEKVRPME